MEAGWRHRSDEPDDEVVGLEDDAAVAVLPDALEGQLELSVSSAFEGELGLRVIHHLRVEAAAAFAEEPLDSLRRSTRKRAVSAASPCSAPDGTGSLSRWFFSS